jgi:predicted transcriptional regulator
MQLYLPLGSLVAREECWRAAIEAEQSAEAERGRAAKSTEKWPDGKVPDVGFS